ncbi:MAG: hypothetical protein AAFY15_07785 [Cyanobacteria bacterium J06648_11]
MSPMRFSRSFLPACHRRDRQSQTSQFWLTGSCILGAGALLLGAGWPLAVSARPILTVKMRLGQSISPKYQYAIALSDESRSPEANLVNPNISADIDDVTFLENWDYLIRVKPINQDGEVESSIQEPGGIEREFATGFNEIDISRDTRPFDTIQLAIDLSDLSALDAEERDVNVLLATYPAPATVESETTILALDATRGEQPNFYGLSLSDRTQVVVEDPQRQETLRRSRDLLADLGTLSGDLLETEGGALEILAANIVTFEFLLEDR